MGTDLHGFFTLNTIVNQHNRDDKRKFIQHMFIVLLLVLDLTVNKVAVVSGLTELIVPERHRNVDRQLYNTAELYWRKNRAL